MARKAHARAATARDERLLREAASHQEGGRLPEAERCYRRYLERSPGDPFASYKLGLVASQAGRTDEAVPHLAQALRAEPGRPAYWLALATALLGAGRRADARMILERFVAQGFTEDESAAARTSLVGYLFRRGHGAYVERNLAEAEADLDLVLLLDERHAEALHLAGNINAETNRVEAGYHLIKLAIAVDDAVAGYHCNLGNVLTHLRRLEEAASSFTRAIELDPLSAVSHSNLGGVHRRLGAPQPAIRCLERALELDPNYARAHNNLGVVLKDLGRHEEGMAHYDRALALDPDFALAHSNRLFAKLYAPRVTPREQYEDALAFGRRFGDPLVRRRPFANDRDPDRRLRVGFVSGDFREHAVNFFFEPALRHLDPAQVETVAFSNTPVGDATTQRLKGLFARWHDITLLNDEAAADLVESEAVDVLVDLSGHTADHRLFVFARKPAPIQVSWIGYPGTTGLSAIDYRFTDRFSEPEGVGDDLSVERLWRLPRVNACYQAHPACPEPIDHPPCDDNGYVTFGCFNRFAKVGDDCLATWARLLRAVPDARLLLEVPGIEDETTMRDVVARLERFGLPLERTILEPRAPKNRYVLYNRIDVALDPFPYNGGTTSLDTLWMGVPFVALEGEHFVARMGASILRNVGLAELVAATTDAYVAVAEGLARDPARLRAVRHDLRGRMAASPHMDPAGLAADVGAAFRGMWRRWLETAPAA